MNLLVLTPQLPYPPHQGTSLRNYNIIRGLSGRHRINLLSYLEPGQSLAPEEIGPLAAQCAAIYTVPAPQRNLGTRLRQLLTSGRPDMAHRLQSDTFEATLRNLLADQAFDVVQIEGIELANVIPIVRRVSPESRILFDDHNAETELQRRAFLTDLGRPVRWPAAAYSLIQVGRLRRFERWACRAADWVTVVSEADRRHLGALAPDCSATVIPNCIDVESYQLAPDPDHPHFDLVFSGKMDYRPNIDAVLWFADQVWPLILRERPTTTWAIVGQKPHARLERLRALPGVTLTGRVRAVQPYLAGAGVVVLPFRLGSGTRLKLIEAMAAGRPVVSTRAGAEGFPVRDQVELLLADRPAAIAAAVLLLLNNSERARQLGQAGQQFAAAYDWRKVIPRFEALYCQRPDR